MYHNPLSALLRSMRALLVTGLSAGTHLLTRLSVRLYARGLVSAVEVRLLLGFSAALTRATLRLAIAGPKETDRCAY